MTNQLVRTLCGDDRRRAGDRRHRLAWHTDSRHRQMGDAIIAEMEKLAA
jgi:hypothetical protein